MALFPNISLTRGISKIPEIWRWVLATPLVIAGCHYFSVAPIGSDVFIWFEFPFILALLAAIPALVVLPFFLPFKKWRARLLPWFFICLVFIPLAISGLFAGEKIRSHAFHQLALRSKPLVEAIQKFEATTGSPPETLEALVPEYLPKVPKTGMMAYEEYFYQTGEAAARYEGNPWVIRISTPSAGINFDEFMYFPLQNYPERGYERYSGYFERIEDWAYLHE